MEVISRDEIRIDSARVKVVIRCKDEWNREIVNQFVVTRPLRKWNDPVEVRASRGPWSRCPIKRTIVDGDGGVK